ncbi:E3 ubiquitin-protein ligase RNF170-like [Rhodnius prolixus]|uniref:E3 ubiquitin-protein ligase RNF170 n=1 Tax=Rhodnius prolixus TaxID=13249 RepID=R4G353_RHOPR
MFVFNLFLDEEYVIFEGVGNEVIISSVVVLISLAILFYYIWKKADWRFFDDDMRDNITGQERNIEPPRASEICSICLNSLIFALETNCGHRFCGLCLLTLYHRNVNGPLRIIVCPLCRTQVNLLLQCYTTAERNAEEGSDLFTQIRRVNSFCSMYNRVYSGVDRSWISTIREIPVLMRHYLDDLMNGGQMPGIMYLNLRMCLLFLFSTVYLILPMDILPETVFGVLGWLDDIFIILTIVLYMCSVYRYYVANNGAAED